MNTLKVSSSKPVDDEVSSQMVDARALLWKLMADTFSTVPLAAYVSTNTIIEACKLLSNRSEVMAVAGGKDADSFDRDAPVAVGLAIVLLAERIVALQSAIDRRDDDGKETEFTKCTKSIAHCHSVAKKYQDKGGAGASLTWLQAMRTQAAILVKKGELLVDEVGRSVMEKAIRDLEAQRIALGNIAGGDPAGIGNVWSHGIASTSTFKQVVDNAKVSLLAANGKNIEVAAAKTNQGRCRFRGGRA